MNISNLRADFPLLRQDNPVAYFDNACMTLKPDVVLAAMAEYNEQYPACGGRSHHRLGTWVTKQVEQARQAVATFINAKHADEIVFVRNTTEGINLLATSLFIQSGDVIVTSDKEHNSNLVPWQRRARQSGARHVVVPTNADGIFDTQALQTILEAGGVRVVALSWVSNLDGTVLPMAEIVALAHAYSAEVVVDAAQAAPHMAIDVYALQADYVVFSGHKLCGPSGTGVLYAPQAKLARLEPFLVGGNTVATTTYTDYELLPAPQKFEAGLQDYAGIIGLGAAVRYVGSIGMERIATKESALNSYATQALTELGVCTILGPQAASARSGILSFTMKDVDVHQIAIMLDQSDTVAVRSGQHCVHSWFHARNILGSVRASFYFYNTEAEIDRFIAGLKKVIAVHL